MRNGFLVVGVVCFSSSFLAYFVSLFVPQEELSICLLAEMSFLTTAMSAWGIWWHLPKGLHLAHDILQVPTPSFQILKGTSNEIKTRILKRSLAKCGESEQKYLIVSLIVIDGDTQNIGRNEERKGFKFVHRQEDGRTGSACREYRVCWEVRWKY